MRIVEPQALYTNNKVVVKSKCPDKPLQAIMNIGFFVVDCNWTLIHWNEGAENITGKAAKNVVVFDFWQACGNALPADFQSRCKEVFAEPTLNKQKVQQWPKMKDWVDVVSYQSDDTLSVSFRSRTPVGPGKDVEDRLTFLNEIYRFITEVSADCLWEWDISAREFFWLDGGHKRAFGYPIVDAIVPQEFWESRIHPEDKDRVLSGLERSIASGVSTIWEDEYRFKNMDDTYCYVHDRAYVICGEGNQAMRMIGATHDITARRQAEIQLLENERILAAERLLKQKEMTEAVLAAQESERAEIGKDLHDNLNQILGAAKMYVELAKVDVENWDFCLNKSSSLIKSVIDEIRKISKTLTAPQRNIMLVAESINIMAEDLAAIYPIKIAFTDNGLDEETLSDKLRLDIFRIIQEQFNNIIKHAEATSATIELTQENSNLLLKIADNGKGCDMMKQNEGIGLLNIRARVEAHYGQLSISSRPGEGFGVMILLPLQSPNKQV